MEYGSGGMTQATGRTSRVALTIYIALLF